jgi:hypothetical protein
MAKQLVVWAVCVCLMGTVALSLAGCGGGRALAPVITQLVVIVHADRLTADLDVTVDGTGSPITDVWVIVQPPGAAPVQVDLALQQNGHYRATWTPPTPIADTGPQYTALAYARNSAGLEAAQENGLTPFGGQP